jgi:Protein of unknown function (DUF2939)
MRRTNSVAALAVCVAAAWLYFTPYLAYGKLTDAADRGDVEALNEVVDFPALRSSFKENIRTGVSRGIDRDGGNPFATIGGALAGMVTAPVVDAAVTPAGIAALTRGNDPRDRDDEDESETRGLERDRRYEGANRFAIRYLDPESGDERIALLMRREGLGWKLTGVRFGGAAAE